MKIYLYGMLAEAINSTEINLTEEPSSVKELFKILLNNHSELKDMSFKIAVNQTLVNDDFLISQNDEIALLPPFAGG